MKKNIFSYSSTGGLRITIEKGRYYEVWVEYPKKDFLLSKVMRTDIEEKARMFVEGMMRYHEITN